MPLSAFECPDGQTTGVLECLATCRMGRRCLSLATLRECARQRPWTGTPSVTQLLNGTRHTYLNITTPYIIKPQSRAFALLGTAHHSRLEEMAFDSETEFNIELSGVTGHPDVLQEHDDGSYTLWDYKTWGSFRVARALGLTAELVDDPLGRTYERSGSWGRAGTVKQVKLWTPNPLLADLEESSLQLNAYRLGIEKAVPVKEMRLQITVRDGGLMAAKQRGVEELIYVLDVPRLDDEEVTAYFSDKAEALAKAIETGFAPKCSPVERWDDERCKGYCDVWFACDHGMAVREAV